MLESYLKGSIIQTISRARQLSRVIDKPYPPHYDGLRHLCSQRLQETLDSLIALERELIVNEEIQTPRRLRVFKRNCEQLEEIETIGATALATAQQEASFLNATVRAICDDIGYPLVPPTVANMSTSHFGIYAEYNLLIVPLLESRYLLHLPDIYHELAHPFLHGRYENRSVLDGYRYALKTAMVAVSQHTRSAVLSAKRERASAGIELQYLFWGQSWQKYWLEEFFCDIFAALTCGPAYAWSHYHLAIKQGDGAFSTPTDKKQTHPPDDARMRIILLSLQKLGFGDECVVLAGAWSDMLARRGERAEPEYRQCFPDSLLQTIVDLAHVGVESMNINLAVPGALTRWSERLNEAWTVFWRDPEAYSNWERARIKILEETTGPRR